MSTSSKLSLSCPLSSKKELLRFLLTAKLALVKHLLSQTLLRRQYHNYSS